MRTRTWCVAAALVCVVPAAEAQSVLSESDALARMSVDSPRVRAIRAAVDVARADALAAGRWPNPRVTFNREAVAGVTENMFLVTQPLPVTGRRGLDADAASALVSATEHRADDEVRRARSALRSAYADLVSAQVREAELSRSRDQLRDLAGILARREAAGESAGYDRLRAAREVSDVEADLAVAHVDRARAQAGVAAFFASPGDPAAIVASAPDRSAPPLPSVEELLAHANSVLGEPAALRSEIESADFADRAAGRRLVPEPELVAGTKSSTLDGGDLGGVLSVHVTVPLFDRAKPERALAQARRNQAEARSAAFRVALAAQIAGLRTVVLERRELADRYRLSTASAEQLERIARVSYDAGEHGILELLDAYRGTAAARIHQAVLDAAVRQAEIELELASGWEIR